MSRSSTTNNGFIAAVVVLALAVVAVAGVVIMRSTGGEVTSSSVESSSKTGNVVWAFNHQSNEWSVKEGKAPDCKEPFVFDYTPVDLSLINVIGMPGSYRGFNYKPHGGLRADGTPSGNVTVRMPADATLVGITRYYEGTPPSLQYLLTFETDCGIAFRFDHLHTLTPAFQKLAETTPAPRLNDSRTDPNITFERTQFKAGEVIATTVGFPVNKNIGFDFGVYDYRSRNEISKNAKWAAIHNKYQSLEWYGVCWLDMLPGADAAKAKQLSLVVLNPAKPKIVSDYCSNAPYTTLDVNGGQPTDG